MSRWRVGFLFLLASQFAASLHAAPPLLIVRKFSSNS